jgi:hypothetical protein
MTSFHESRSLGIKCFWFNEVKVNNCKTQVNLREIRGTTLIENSPLVDVLRKFFRKSLQFHGLGEIEDLPLRARIQLHHLIEDVSDHSSDSVTMFVVERDDDVDVLRTVVGQHSPTFKEKKNVHQLTVPLESSITICLNIHVFDKEWNEKFEREGVV